MTDGVGVAATEKTEVKRQNCRAFDVEATGGED